MKGTYYKTPIVCKREQPFFNRQTTKFAHRQIIYYLCALIYKYYFKMRERFLIGRLIVPSFFVSCNKEENSIINTQKESQPISGWWCSMCREWKGFRMVKQ